jgi:hypothetical protein
MAWYLVLVVDFAKLSRLVSEARSVVSRAFLPGTRLHLPSRVPGRRAREHSKAGRISARLLKPLNSTEVLSDFCASLSR